MRNLYRMVRVAEVGVIVVLSGFALVTYRELSALRRFPVSLPSYQFEVGGEPAGGVVSTRGTWITERGTPELLLTTSIECRKAGMECTESAARVVFMGGQGLMESEQTRFAVERWSDDEIVTRAAHGTCAQRHLVLDLKARRATSRVAASEEKGACRGLPARTLELVAGYRVRALAD